MARGAVLVTGASAGLGALFARRYAGQGRKIVLVARREDRLRALADEIGGAEIIAADLAQPGAADRLIDRLQANGISIETLINNAGFGQLGRFADQPIERQLEMVQLNVSALVEITHRLLPPMWTARRGGILNVASVAAFQPGPGMAVYYATKAFVLSFSEALHEELRGSGVHVTALCPGPTRTEFADVAGMGASPLKRFAGGAGAVVDAGIAGLEHNRAVVLPGLSNSLLAQSNRLFPRALVRKIVGRLQAERSA